MIDHDGSWTIMMDHDGSWSVMVHHDRSWSIMVIHDWSWSMMIHHDGSWSIMILNGQSWSIMTDYAWKYWNTTKIHKILIRYINIYRISCRSRFWWSKSIQKIPKVTKWRRNHEFPIWPHESEFFSRRFQKSQSQYEKLAPNVEKSMISKCHVFSRGRCSRKSFVL